MLIPALLFFAALTVRPGHGELRSGCSADDAVVAVLPAGSTVELRFALSDGSDCYKVSAMAGGKAVEGYVSAPALNGLEVFERSHGGARDPEWRNSPRGPAQADRRADTVAIPGGSSTGDKLSGTRVLLSYDAAALSPQAAGSLVGLLDTEYARISAELGCSVRDKIVAIVESRQTYLRATDAAEWSAGMFDGRIRVALPEAGHPAPDIRKVLAHEMAHACLSDITQRWPAWFQEGVARKVSGDTLSAGEAALIRELVAAHRLPRLENIAQSWSRMSAQHAQTAYAVALAAVELMQPNLRGVLANPALLPSVTAGLDRQLGL